MDESASRIKVLIVEDSPDFASVIHLVLKAHFEAATVIAQDCRSARYALAREDFDLVTLDYRLPDGTGLELMEEITSVRDHPPVIMVTAHGDESTASDAIRLGADGYVVKDQRMQTLLVSSIDRLMERQQYKKAVLDSERQYRELVELASSVILKMDGEGTILFMNRYGCEFFGYSEEEIVGRNAVGTIVPEVESTGRGLAAMIKDIVVRPDAHRTNFNENMLRDGKRVWILWGNRSIKDEDGNIVGTLSIGNDVTDLQQSSTNLENLTAIYSLTISIIRRLWQQGDSGATLPDVCETFDQSGLFKMVWMGQFDEETGCISQVCTAGDSDYLEGIDLSAVGRDWIRPGSGAANARNLNPLICNDITCDARTEPWWEEATRRGYRSSAIFPIGTGDRVVAVMGLYIETPGFFTIEVTNLLKSLAKDVSIVVEPA